MKSILHIRIAALLTAIILAVGLTGCSEGLDKANTIGNTAKGEHYAITVLDAVTANHISGAFGGFDPDEGNEFLLMAMEVENIVDEERHLSWPFGEAVADGKQVHIDMPLADAEIKGVTYGPLNWSDSLYKGDSIKTYLCVNLPTEWQKCEYEFDGVQFTIERDQVDAGPQQASEKTAPESTPTPQPTPTPTPVPKAYTLQERGQTENYAVTLLDGTTVNKVWENDYRYYEAGAGKTFLILAFEIENTTDATQDIWVASDFDVSVDAYQCDLTRFGFTPPAIEMSGISYEALGSDIITTAYQLGSGKRVQGYLAAEIPEGGTICEIVFDGATFTCSIEGNSIEGVDGTESITAAPAGNVSYIPGTYSASSQGLSSDITVTMTLDETRITDVQVDASGEIESIGGAAASEMAQRILSAQSANVDTVAGATVTSDAIKMAAVDCIAQAET